MSRKNQQSNGDSVEPVDYEPITLPTPDSDNVDPFEPAVSPLDTDASLQVTEGVPYYKGFVDTDNDNDGDLEREQLTDLPDVGVGASASVVQSALAKNADSNRQGEIRLNMQESARVKVPTVAGPLDWQDEKYCANYPELVGVDNPVFVASLNPSLSITINLEKFDQDGKALHNKYGDPLTEDIVCKFRGGIYNPKKENPKKWRQIACALVEQSAFGGTGEKPNHRANAGYPHYWLFREPKTQKRLVSNRLEYIRKDNPMLEKEFEENDTGAGVVEQ